MENKKKKVVVADDDESILEVVKIMLEDFGSYQVQTESNGEKLLKMEEDLPDLILLDLWMSGMYGGDICESLKSNPKTKNIPVILFSANRDIKQIQQKVLADDYIEKPFDMNNLLSKIKKHIDA